MNGEDPLLPQETLFLTTLLLFSTRTQDGFGEVGMSLSINI